MKPNATSITIIGKTTKKKKKKINKKDEKKKTNCIEIRNLI